MSAESCPHKLTVGTKIYESTIHFRERFAERKIDLLDVKDTLRNGKSKKKQEDDRCLERRAHNGTVIWLENKQAHENDVLITVYKVGDEEQEPPQGWLSLVPGGWLAAVALLVGGVCAVGLALNAERPRDNEEDKRRQAGARK